MDTGLTPEQAPKELIPESQFIAYKNKAWIPVEITAIHDGFMKAWQLGAKEWTENNSIGQAGFYPIQEAWNVYQPVGLPGADITISVPQSDSILRAYLGEVQKYLDAALAPMVAKLQEQIQSTGQPLGDEQPWGPVREVRAVGQGGAGVQAGAGKKQYLPAILNLGHLYYSRKDWKNALGLLPAGKRGGSQQPSHSACPCPGEPGAAELRRCEEQLRQAEGRSIPTLAGQFAYLGEAKESGTRAADVESQRIAVIWETDQ